MQDPNEERDEHAETPSAFDGGGDEDPTSSSGDQSPTPADEADPQPS